MRIDRYRLTGVRAAIAAGVTVLMALWAQAAVFDIEYGTCPSAALNCNDNTQCWIEWSGTSACPTGYRCIDVQCTGGMATQIKACQWSATKQDPPCNNGTNSVMCVATCTVWSGSCVDTNSGCSVPNCGGTGGTTYVTGYSVFTACT